MHWLKQYRMEHPIGGKPMSCKELARRVKKPGTISNPGAEIGCSEVLIGILEGGGITHPLIANRIADICGATPQQRDMLVHKMHWGTYRPPRRRPQENKPRLAPTDPGFKPANARAVVRIDMYFQCRRFESIREAAMAEGCNESTVKVRCERALSGGTNEFLVRDHTWRYADEWEDMTVDERVQDLHNAGLYRG